MHRLRITAAALLLLLGGCATENPAGPANPVVPSTANSSQLRPGDSLIIGIFGVPDPSNTTAQIDDRGMISLPYIGAIKAAGLTTASLTQSIRETYVSKRIYNVVDISVSVTERYVYVGGEVQRPGRIIWTPDLTAAKAIQAAGGFTLYAKEDKVGLVREQVRYDLNVPLSQKNPAQDPRLEPGDSLLVPRSAF
jgi:protein involved in polysaccharide export with SLBB domain